MKVFERYLIREVVFATAVVLVAFVALFSFFESLRIPFVELYGMSETAGFISSNLFAGKRRAGSAGVLTPDHEVRFGADGELLLRGPLLLSGYLEPEDGAAI